MAFQHKLLALSIGAVISVGAQAYTQAPMLDAVKDLPPVDQRLPSQPLVIKPLGTPGIYGGTLRTVLRANADQNGILRTIGSQGLMHWKMDVNGVEPYVAESLAVNPSGTEYTFRLRKGMRWSNGEPFTADDVLFAMNDLVASKEFYSQAPDAYLVNGKLPEVTKLDDNTVKFKFDAPNLSFPEVLATPLGQHPVLYSKQYCQQFHPKYNPKVSEQFASANVKDWPSLMRAKCGDVELPSRWSTVGRPTLDPWLIKEPYGGNVTRVVMERNPYYWQVDPTGKQLPYLDSIRFAVISDLQTIVLAASNGQFDFEGRLLGDVAFRPILLKNQQKAGYKVFSQASSNSNAVGLWMNQTTKNDKLRKLMVQHDFRKALSLGIDREEINKVAFLGQTQPWQSGPFKESKWYNAQLGSQYTKADVAQANAILDKMGLSTRDDAGYRLYPDGGRVSLDVIVMIDRQVTVQTLELIRRHWQKIGVELVIKGSERSLVFNRAVSNDYDISAEIFPGGLDATQNARAYIAIHPLESRMSLEWAKWYNSGGKQGIEPNASMKKRMDLYTQWRSARTQTQADELFRQILQIAADEFEVIGTVRPAAITSLRNAKLMNVKENMAFGWTYASPALGLPQQWYYAK
ncbi:ABC transporter substrate-binding protein [Uliginosibacterium sp. sgz301328]|uniref:ABC transporter substrate-binding protein n=1 Tax=Uliginosibacterium sp. sgz301328 TaxID=3243764 RepID=UPI00359D9C41